MTDEAREAFTVEVMPTGWPREHDATRNFNSWSPECRRAWLYDARIALESKLGYSIRFTAAEQWETWSPDMIRLSHTCGAAIEAGVMDWWERRIND